MSGDRRAVSSRTVRSRRVAPAGAGEPDHALVEDTLNLPVSDPFRNRKDGKIHVSEIMYGCLRAIFLSRKYGIPLVSRPLYASRGLIFAMGRAAEAYQIERLWGNKSDEFSVYGAFSCKSCGHILHAATTADNIPSSCPSCKTPTGPSTYNGIVVDDGFFVGHVDYAVAHKGSRTVRLYEAKTTTSKHFSNYVASPEPVHLTQAFCYHALCHDTWSDREYSLGSNVGVVYALKDPNPFSSAVTPLQEVVVSAVDNRAAEIKKTLRSQMLPVRNGTIPAFNPSAEKSGRCKICTVSALCHATGR